MIEYKIRADGTYGKRRLGDLTVAGDFKCERCMYGEAVIDSICGIVCRFCGHQTYDDPLCCAARWMGRAVFRFRDGRSKVIEIDARRPRVWLIREFEECEDDPTWTRSRGAFAYVQRVFDRRDWAAKYGFIGPTRDSEYVER